MAEKDSLVPLGPAECDPYRAKASEFPVKKVVAAFGQSVDAPGEQDQLIKQSEYQEGPRCVEAEGGEKDSMSTRAKMVSTNFPIKQNDGESSSMGQMPSIPESVDLMTGQVTVSGYKRTRGNEVAERTVSIG